jgi:ATP-binding cassette subfamily F protein 3
MIEIKGIEKGYGEKILFSGCSLRLGARDRIGLVGPNGSGKTTLFRMIAGEEQADRGEIIIGRGVHMGYLSQEPMPLKGQSLIEEVQSGVKDLTALEDKMRLLEEDIAEEKDTLWNTKRKQSFPDWVSAKGICIEPRRNLAEDG